MKIFLANEYGESVAELEKTQFGFYKLTENGATDIANALFADGDTLTVKIERT